MNIDWNAEEYRKNFSFVYHYGNDVLEMIDVPKGSFVVDLGCGNGALTEKIAGKGYKALGIDGSDEMLSLAKKLHPSLEFRKDDARFFSLENKADVIFSNAVFHWIDAKDQDKMLVNIRKNLKKGGEFVFEFGGFGCAETVHSSLEKAFQNYNLKYPRFFYFPTIGEYAPKLEKAGFLVQEAFLFNRPTPQNGGERGLKDWIKMFCKKPFENLDDELSEKIIDEATESARSRLFKNGTWIVDYVRIRIKAKAI